jgi:ApbE superfamily uncharacterized protein (UPF0280 family)
MTGPASARLSDERLHWRHGPIDLVIKAWGKREEVEHAYAQGWRRFQDVLGELVAELPTLRAPVGTVYPLLRRPAACRMAAAVWPHREVYITPMAAVAGAVADEILAALCAGRGLRKAYVNNGGDIALHIAPGEQLEVGVVNDPQRPALAATARIEHASPVRGVATSGWRGRSQSLGIADAVTVLASTAAEADAAATLVANAVNTEHPAVRRIPARQLREDSDLGEWPVTISVGALPLDGIAAALDAGVQVANDLCARGALYGAYLALQGQVRTVLPAYARIPGRRYRKESARAVARHASIRELS